jgi:putative MATE family efflux protein
MAEANKNIMGTMPVGKLLIKISVPLMISMLVQALYNIIDSIFVAQISEDALAAVTLAFPIQGFMISLAVGTGVGLNSLMSRRLGEKRKKEANEAAENGIFLAILSWIGFALFGFLFSGKFLHHMATAPAIAQMGTDYISVCCIFSLGLFVVVAQERMMLVAGLSFYYMVTQIAGAVINIILDPILIFGLLGFPVLGVKGAAIATVIGQFGSMAIAIAINKRRNFEVTPKLRGFKPNGKVIGEIYSVGIPAIAMSSIGSILMVALNGILIGFSNTAVAVYGVYFRLQNFVFLPVFGLNNGMVSILGYNYGAGLKDRIYKSLRRGAFYALLIMACGLVIFQLFPRQLLLLFNASPQMLELGIPAMRIISLCFIPAGISIVTGALFAAVGRNILSLIISFMRQIVVILPLAYLFAHFAGVRTLWYAFPLAEILALLLTIYFFRRINNRYISCLTPLDNQYRES